MSNYLESGAVLPFGLLGSDTEAMMKGFNRSFNDTKLRAGIIMKAYDINDDKNRTGLCTEYDVLVIEQDENKGTTSLIYRNCLSKQGLGGIGDYLEAALRPKKHQTTKGQATAFSGQDGSIVLIECLDGIGDKAIILGCLQHPDRDTTIVTTDPKLEGEYNGCHVLVDNDGSFTFTFKGATDNYGNILDSTQGPTVVKIEHDGSFQINHSTITFRLDRNGTATLTATGDVDVNCANVNIAASKNITATCVNMEVDTSGTATINSQGDTVVNSQANVDVTAKGNAVVQAAEIHLNGADGKVLTTVTDPVIDTIFGEPTIGVPTVKSG